MLYLKVKASLTEPSDVLAINLRASSEIFPFSFFEIFFKCFKRLSTLTLFKIKSLTS